MSDTVTAQAEALVAAGDVPAIVDRAIELGRTAKEATQQLDVLKEGLRKEARKEATRSGASSVEFKGFAGVIQVVFPNPVPAFLKGVDANAEIEGLPQDLRETLFTRRVVFEFNPEFLSVFRSLPPAQQEAVSRFVETVFPTARVNLPR